MKSIEKKKKNQKDKINDLMFNHYIKQNETITNLFLSSFLI